MRGEWIHVRVETVESSCQESNKMGKKDEVSSGKPWSIGGPWSSFDEKWPGADCVGKLTAGVTRVAGTIHRRDE